METFGPPPNGHNRYALVAEDRDAGRIWSVGGAWSASLLSQSPALMTGPQADALLSRHPEARIVDVVVYREALKAYNAGVSAVIDRDAGSTPEGRLAAREAGLAAMVQAGFPKDALDISLPAPDDGEPGACMLSAFKPSFPNPEVWTDELIVKRHAEFAAFEKSPAGIAEQRAFNMIDAHYQDGPPPHYAALNAQECSEQAPSLERIVAAMKSHVLHLIEIGQVPSETASFVQLHDYCDANCLGGLGDDEVFDVLIHHFGGRDEHDGLPKGMQDILDAAMNAIDAWLAAGRR